MTWPARGLLWPSLVAISTVHRLSKLLPPAQEFSGVVSCRNGEVESHSTARSGNVPQTIREGRPKASPGAPTASGGRSRPLLPRARLESPARRRGRQAGCQSAWPAGPEVPASARAWHRRPIHLAGPGLPPSPHPPAPAGRPRAGLRAAPLEGGTVLSAPPPGGAGSRLPHSGKLSRASAPRTAPGGAQGERRGPGPPRRGPA